MKLIRCLTIIALLLVFGIGSSHAMDFSKIYVGPRVGLGSSTLTGVIEDNDLRPSSDLTWNGGINGWVSMTDRIDLMLGLFYKDLGTTYEKPFKYSYPAEDNISFQYFNLNIIGKLNLAPFLWIGTGPSFSLFMDKSQREIEVINELTDDSIVHDFAKQEKTFVIAWDLALGFVIPFSDSFMLNIDTIYEFGITDAIDVGDDNKHTFNSISFLLGVSLKLDI